MPGMDPEYDYAVAAIKETQRQLDLYLEKQKELLSCRVRAYLALPSAIKLTSIGQHLSNYCDQTVCRV